MDHVRAHIDRLLLQFCVSNNSRIAGHVSKRLTTIGDRSAIVCVQMCTLRPFTCQDLFHYNTVNLDPLTETYNLGFYLTYLSKWPEYFYVAESPSGNIMGYIMGKSEARQNNPLDWHGHVTAVSVADKFRRIGLAAILMHHLEKVSELKHCYFVDLFVRVSNTVAITMYKNMGYKVFRTILSYYTSAFEEAEDAYDMRKALSRDRDKDSEKPCTDPDYPLEA